jgi:hypothetical protein
MEVPEDSIYALIAAAIETAEEGEAFFGLELHDTLYRPIKGSAVIRLGDAAGHLAPDSGYTSAEELDVVVPLHCLAAITGKDKNDRTAARTKARDLAHAVALLFFKDPTMGGSQQDSRALDFLRGWSNIDSKPYAEMIVPIVVNETGKVDFTNWRP